MDNSPLGTLPGEIRNRIYDFIFIPQQHVDMFVHDKEAESSPTGSELQDRSPTQYVAAVKMPITNIRSACRELYAETAAYRYDIHAPKSITFNAFVFDETTQLDRCKTSKRPSEASLAYIQRHDLIVLDRWTKERNFASVDTECRPTKIEIDLGTWDMTLKRMHPGRQIDATSLLTPILKRLHRANIETYYTFKVVYGWTSQGPRYLATITIPADDKKACLDAVNDICRNEYDRFNRERRTGVITEHEYRDLDRSLQMHCQASINRFVDLRVSLD